MKLHVNPDGTLTLCGDLTGRGWRKTLTPDQLPGRLNFYRCLRDRGSKPGKPGPWARFYTETVDQLERAIAAQPATRKDR